MAFTFTVEDGSIVAGANSFVSMEEATEILSFDMKRETVWSGLAEDETRQKYLALATRFLCERVFWYGKRTDKEQPLCWPRQGMRDIDGNCIADSVIPIEIKKATVYTAVWLVDNDPEEAYDNAGVKRFRNNDVEIEWQDTYMGLTFPTWLVSIVSTFGTGPGQRGFKPILRVN